MYFIEIMSQNFHNFGQWSFFGAYRSKEEAEADKKKYEEKYSDYKPVFRTIGEKA